MKKIICGLMALALLCTLAACGTAQDNPTTAPVTTTAPAGEIAPEDLSFTTYYAKTPSHLYALLAWKDENAWRGRLAAAPRSDISQTTELPLPAEYEGKALERPRICGITTDWIYINLEMQHPNGNVVYRVPLKDGMPLESGAAEFVSRCYGLSWYSNGSLLMVQREDGKNRLEALDLAANERSVIYDTAFNADGISDIWYHAADGSALMEMGSENWLQIDADLQVKTAAETGNVPLKANAQQAETQDKVNQLLGGDLSLQTAAAWDEWYYYVEWEEGHDELSLYRMKKDGSGKELLRKDTNIYQLLCVGDRMFALAEYMRDDDIGETADVKLHELGADGKALWSRACGTTSGDAGVGMFFSDGLLMANYYIYGGGHTEYFVIAYDPAAEKFLEDETGGVFGR